MSTLEMLFGHVTMASAFRVACPMIVAAMGGVFSHSAGVFNFAYECIMLCGAFFAAYGSHISGSYVVGGLFAAGVGMLLAAVFGFFVYKLKANAALVSSALNMSAWALTTLLLYTIFGVRGRVVSDTIINYPKIHFDFLDRFPTLSYILNDNIWMVYFAYILVIAAFVVMYHTSFGLRCRGVGINPAAAETVGVNVGRMRWTTLLIMGLFSGLAGSYMPMSGLSTFNENMTSGVGFLVWAAILVGKSNPVLTAITCFVFAYTDALSTVLTALEVPMQLVSMIPYATVIVTLFVVGLRSFTGKPRILGD